MKVPDGMTVHRGGRRYRSGEELPDDLLPTVKTEPVAYAGDPSVGRGPTKRPADEPARKG